MFFRTIKKRQLFKEIAKSELRFFGKALILQAAPNNSATPGEVQLGFTVSKKIGHACFRNKTKRRLKSIFRALPEGILPSSHYYVAIARVAIKDKAYQEISTEIEKACKFLKSKLK